MLCGQTPPLPRFAITDVHASPPSFEQFERSYGLRDGRYEFENATMVDLISAAYGVEGNQVLGGPSWLEWDRFDVIAKAPPGATRQTANEMLQALLADRFQLVVHKDTKPVSGYVLTVAKGKPKLKEAAGSGNSGCRPTPPEPNSLFMGVACRKVDMESFARMLRFYARDYFDALVVDSTGLKGSWDFDVKWTRRELLGRAGNDHLIISNIT
jgi:uncharacterized protein (TIGR03435 family)